jgi:hypothetical protein
MEAQGERMYSSYSFTTSALDGVVSVTPRPRYIPRERIPNTHCTVGWVGPKAGLDTEVKILSPLPGFEPRSPGRPARSQTLYWLSYPAHEMVCYQMFAGNCIIGENTADTVIRIDPHGFSHKLNNHSFRLFQTIVQSSYIP